MKSIAIIPARYGSTRFPGKPLALIGGKPMIQRVYEQCIKSRVERVVVATDDGRIKECVESFGGDAVMTSSDLSTGTARCRAALISLNEDFERVINVQGDEPFIDPDQINQVLSLLEKRDTQVATLVSPALGWDEVNNPNRVKVVTALDGRALYFSRLPIPFTKDETHTRLDRHLIHLGIYGFDANFLLNTDQLRPSELEEAESLEQLSWLENGFTIYTQKTQGRADAVDTREDLEAIEKKYFL
jgi:3-deoxy-manno-octulosonate cytidylyltransferase (CMP-KDO synthetase)